MAVSSLDQFIESVKAELTQAEKQAAEVQALVKKLRSKLKKVEKLKADFNG